MRFIGFLLFCDNFGFGGITVVARDRELLGFGGITVVARDREILGFGGITIVARDREILGFLKDVFFGCCWYIDFAKHIIIIVKF